MGSFYTDAQVSLQAEFGTKALAARLVDAAVTTTLSEDQAAFIHSRDMFYLATVDADGFPSCSYKGGARGFARVLNPNEISFPLYDGNGMFLSAGNIEASRRLGLLFIDFEKPNRLRVRGEAEVLRDGVLVDSYPGAIAAVRVAVSAAWQNCPRYVHRMQPVEASPHVPDAQGRSPFALWKRIDVLQDVLTDADRTQAQSLGLITIDEYTRKAGEGVG